MSDSLRPYEPCQAPLSVEFSRNSPRILEWVAMPSSRGSSQTQRWNSHLLQLLHYKQILYHWANGEAPDAWILTLKFFSLNSAFFRVKGLLLIPLPFLLYLNHPGHGFLLWWALNLYLPILQGHHLLEAYQDLPFCSANAEPNGILCIFT